MMKSIILLALVAFGASVPCSTDLDEHWERFKVTFNKRYHPREEGARRLIWEERVKNVIHHNLEADLGLHTYTKGINERSDLSKEEFTKTFKGYVRSNRIRRPAIVFSSPSNTTVPKTVDWRKHGLVTPIKDQEVCESCWAFSATGSLEGQHKKKTGKLVSLSEQNLIDCSKPQGNNGCNGGDMDQAFDYVIQNKGINTEKSYPYTAEDGECRFNKKSIGATCTGYEDIPSGDEDALLKAVATIGPISVAIDASQDSFQEYKDGIYNELNCTSEAGTLDHGVLAIGYGTENGKDYWLVKNSWGTSWGIKGYIKMSRNENNQCGIATEASYPVM